MVYVQLIKKSTKAICTVNELTKGLTFIQHSKMKKNLRGMNPSRSEDYVTANNPKSKLKLSITQN
jgi:hypothetical protein